MDEKHRQLIKNARDGYRNIRYVSCRAFGGEQVYFTRAGFEHLIFKNRKYRPKDQQVGRIALIEKAIQILGTAKQFSGHRTHISNKKSSAVSLVVVHNLWSFTENIGGQNITVVVRQIGTGSKHFLSVIDKTKSP